MEPSKEMSREEAAEYWAANEITAEDSSEVTEGILVRRPLRSIRQAARAEPRQRCRRLGSP